LALGERTASGDRETAVVERKPVDLKPGQLERVLQQFEGAITQLPPMHSALKKGGRALYDYARAGVEVERSARPVRIHHIRCVSLEAAQLVIDVACSKGTYIRTLADDIGQALGCGAHLSALRRTASGPLRLDDALSFEALEVLDAATRDAVLRPADSLLALWPELCLEGGEAARFLTGLRRRVAAPDAPAVRVYAQAPRAFLGSGHVTAGELIADRLLSPAEVQACAAAHEA
jgi:tRNA pseudouridine55 synthase